MFSPPRVISSRNLESRRAHVAEEHNGGSNSNKKGAAAQKTVCPKCGKSLVSSYAPLHEARCLGIPNPRIMGDFVYVPHPTDPTLCPEPGCDFTNNKVKVRAHFLKHHIKVPCKVCNVVYNIVNIDGHMLTAHKIATPRASRHACEDCGVTFVYKSQLKNHMDLEHIKEEKYVCDMCGMRFIARRLLYNHRDSAHTRVVRRNPCAVCGKNFRSVKPMKDHMFQEHGVKVK